MIRQIATELWIKSFGVEECWSYINEDFTFGYQTRNSDDQRTKIYANLGQYFMVHKIFM